MNRNSFLSIAVFSAFGLAVLGAVAIVGTAERKHDPLTSKSREFVCTMDDKLTERHIGVKTVRLVSGRWLLEYIEPASVPVYYMQVAGETCSVEEY